MAISRVQYKGDYGSTGTSNSITLDSTPTANNLLIAVIVVRTGASVPYEISGWTRFLTGNGTSGAGNLSVACFYKISDGTESTVTFDWYSSYENYILVAEYTGNATSGVLDAAVSLATYLATANAASTAYSPGSMTPGQNEGLCFSAQCLGSGSSTCSQSVSSPHTLVDTLRNGFTYDPQIAFSQNVYSDGSSQEPQWTTSQSVKMFIMAALFNAPMTPKNVSHLLCLGVG